MPLPTTFLRTGLSGVLAALCLTACSTPMPGSTSSVGMPAPYPSSQPDALGALFNSQLNADIQANLANPTTLPPTSRLGLLFYGYGVETDDETQQALLQKLTTAAQGNAAVKSVFLIPSSLVRPGESIDNIRRIASRFGVDAVLFVSGEQSVKRSAEQPSGFFDSFSSKVNMEARTLLTGLVLDTLSGRFLSPAQAAAKAGPELLNPESSDYAKQLTRLKRTSAEAAFDALDTQLLKLIQDAPKTGSPTPTPSPSAS